MKLSMIQEALRVEADGAWLKLPDWHMAPSDARIIAEELRTDGYPVGIVHDAILGWCVLCTAGQGPMFAYTENADLLPMW